MAMLHFWLVSVSWDCEFVLWSDDVEFDVAIRTYVCVSIKVRAFRMTSRTPRWVYIRSIVFEVWDTSKEGRKAGGEDVFRGSMRRWESARKHVPFPTTGPETDDIPGTTR